MSYAFREESPDSLRDLHATSPIPAWEPLFVHPAWLRAWWDCFGNGREPCLRTFRQDDALLGVAPLMTAGDTAYFMGDTDVCDYQDFIVTAGYEDAFCQTLLDYLKTQGIKKLELAHLRPDSFTLTHLAPAAEANGCKISKAKEDVSVEMPLPDTWDGYLETLNGKQRHEVRRKLRRLAEAGAPEVRFTTDAAGAAAELEDFFRMFRTSRRDKEAFLTPEMEAYFRRLTEAMADAGLLRLGALEVDGKTVAMIMCFGYNGGLYLYNSGFDTDYDYLSVGLMSKVLAIKDGIERGCKKFDFLKGDEVYKYRLGGQEVPLYRCRIELQ